MTTYTITDTTTGTTATIETDAIAATVIGWCPDAPADVVAAATSLEQAIRNGDPADEFAAFLAVTVDRSPAITAEIVDLNDLVVVDDREVSFDTVEVRRGDVVLATIRVESSEDEAPYAAAVAEFGDVTWL
ncbi:MAG: hypothetical protein IPI21_13870 [Propionivibrio sp.]|nr:hypothetical protein [Propionivibrio sp.]